MLFAFLSRSDSFEQIPQYTLDKNKKLIKTLLLLCG